MPRGRCFSRHGHICKEIIKKRIFGAWSNPKFTVSAILGEMPEKRVLRSLNVLIYSLEAYSPGWVAGDRGRRQMFAVATCLVNFFFQCICTDPGGLVGVFFALEAESPGPLAKIKRALDGICTKKTKINSAISGIGG